MNFKHGWRNNIVTFTLNYQIFCDDSVSSPIIVLLRVLIWTIDRRRVNFPLDLITVQRPNYPQNCFILNISDIQEEKQQMTPRQIYFKFQKPIVKTSVQIHLQDKQLFCHREIKDNLFYFSGSSIILEDIGEVCCLILN